MNWIDRKIDGFIGSIRDSDRQPVEIAGSYWRWFVWPRNRFLNCYLHHWHGDDKNDLHDHRMMNISIILQGDYTEDRFLSKPSIGFPLPDTINVPRHRFRLYFRLPSTPHRVVLNRSFGLPVKCWSLFIGFPHWREWGFWTDGGKWVRFEDYVEDPDPLSPGYGRRK